MGAAIALSHAARERSSLSVADLTRELRASETLVQAILPDFVEKGLVLETARNVFRYHPAVAELERLVERVAAAYAQNRIKLINEIFRTPEPSAQALPEVSN
jgi:hypothetical protein